MNATGRNLRGCEFVGQSLNGAIFDGCDLNGVLFWDCILRRTSFKGARLTGAIIRQCDMKEADLTDAVINGVVLGDWRHDLALSEQQMVSTRSYKTKDLSKCVIYGFENGAVAKRHYDFRGANLAQATIVGGDFTQTDFTNADISQIRFRGCTITFSQLASTETFRERSLDGIDFDVAIKGTVDLSGLNLRDSKLRMSFSEADFTGADIARATIGGNITQQHFVSTRNYQEGDLSGVTFLGLNLAACDLSRQNLTGCRFQQCDFTGADLNEAVITDAHFAFGNLYSDNVGLTVEQIKSTWNYKHGRMAAIRLPEEVGKALEQKERKKR